MTTGDDGQKVVAQLTAERDAALAQVASYENRITWDTTCENCARLLDASYADHIRAETAKADHVHEINRARQWRLAADAWQQRAEAAEAVVARVQELHKRIDVATVGGSFASREQREASMQPTCQECISTGYPYGQWPCPTIAAVAGPTPTTIGRCTSCDKVLYNRDPGSEQQISGLCLACLHGPVPTSGGDNDE